MGIGYRLSDSPKKCPTFSGTKLLQNSEMGKFFSILLLFCQIYIAKLWKTCYKTYFFVKIFGGYEKKQYLCTVFFMVLDLRLSKDWVVGMTILLFLCIFSCFFSRFFPILCCIIYISISCLKKIQKKYINFWWIKKKVVTLQAQIGRVCKKPWHDSSGQLLFEAFTTGLYGEQR